MDRSRNLPAHIAFAMLMFFGYPVKGQVFVHTILDRLDASPTADAIASIKGVQEGYKTTLQTFAERTNARARAAKQPAVTDDEIDVALEGLKPTTTDADAQTICAAVAGALTNRLLPVRWKSERSVCLWNQSKLDWVQQAQVVGGDRQGTASVEIASDVFWGLRVRIQSSVAGTSSSDPDAQAKAALKQLQTAGGNVSVGATYPWYLLASSSGRVTGIFTSYVRVAGAVPALGGSNTTTATMTAHDANGNVEVAPLDAMLQIQSFKNTINFVLTGRQSFVNGTHAFNTQVMNTGHRGFMYNQIGVGLRFQQVVWLVASRSNFSHHLPGGGMTYSVIFGKQPNPPPS